jgi:hypothetical protein
VDAMEGIVNIDKGLDDIFNLANSYYEDWFDDSMESRIHALIPAQPSQMSIPSEVFEIIISSLSTKEIGREARAVAVLESLFAKGMRLPSIIEAKNRHTQENELWVFGDWFAEQWLKISIFYGTALTSIMELFLKKGMQFSPSYDVFWKVIQGYRHSDRIQVLQLLLDHGCVVPKKFGTLQKVRYAEELEKYPYGVALIQHIASFSNVERGNTFAELMIFLAEKGLFVSSGQRSNGIGDLIELYFGDSKASSAFQIYLSEAQRFFHLGHLLQAFKNRGLDFRILFGTRPPSRYLAWFESKIHFFSDDLSLEQLDLIKEAIAAFGVDIPVEKPKKKRHSEL